MKKLLNFLGSAVWLLIMSLFSLIAGLLIKFENLDETFLEKFPAGELRIIFFLSCSVLCFVLWAIGASCEFISFIKKKKEMKKNEKAS